MYCDIEECFDLNLVECQDLCQLIISPLTELVCKYRDFNTVLDFAGNMRYDIGLIADVCGISEDEARRQLLEKELLAVLEYFDFWQTEEVKEEYIDIYNAYVDCLMSEDECMLV